MKGWKGMVGTLLFTALAGALGVGVVYWQDLDKNWSVIVVGACAAVIPVVINYLNPQDERYGIVGR